MYNLYDEKGYQVRIEISRTFNPKQRGESEDTRDLGVFFTYIGAVQPEHEDASYTFENDAYVILMLFQDFMEWRPRERGEVKEILLI